MSLPSQKETLDDDDSWRLFSETFSEVSISQNVSMKILVLASFLFYANSIPLFLLLFDVCLLVYLYVIILYYYHIYLII